MITREFTDEIVSVVELAGKLRPGMVVETVLIETDFAAVFGGGFCGGDSDGSYAFYNVIPPINKGPWETLIGATCIMKVQPRVWDAGLDDWSLCRIEFDIYADDSDRGWNIAEGRVID